MSTANNPSNVEDDVPPLEDMADYVEALKKKKADDEGSSSKRQVVTDTSLLQLEDDTIGISRPNLVVCKPEKMQTTGKEGATTRTATTNSNLKSNEGSGAFGGMRKGFLSGGRTSGKTKKSVKSTSIEPPMICGKGNGEKNQLVIDEVQEEIRKTHPLLATKDWITDDLLTKIEDNPVLSKAFKDPSLFQVLEEFHKDPKQAMAAAQNNPEVREFLQQFCAIMGNHFTSLADRQEKEGPMVSEEPTPEQLQVQNLLSNPEVKTALLDPDIRRLMEFLKTHPQEAEQFLSSIETKPGIQSKLRTLIDNGLLTVQRKQSV